MTDSPEYDDLLQRQIDRLIDGELPEAELASVLSQLDDEPGGWRRCGLAFVETQQMRAAMSELVEPVPAAPVVPRDPAHRQTGVARFGARWSSVGLLLAVVLAFLGGRVSTSDRNEPRRETAEAVTTTTDGGADTVKQEPVPEDPPGLQIVGYARIHGPVGKGPVVPVVSGPEFTEEDLLSQPLPIPDGLRRRAGNRGYQMQCVREVMSLQLADGRRLAVPMDAVSLRYVGNPIF